MVKEYEKRKDTKDFHEKMKAQGWREIDRSKIPQPKQPKSSGDVKSRITIYLDTDIVSFYKELAEDSDNGYQTLINQSLREIVDRKPRTGSYISITKLLNETRHSDAKAFNELGKIYREKGLINAIEILEKASKSNDLPYNELGKIYQEQKGYVEAIEMLNEVLRIQLNLDIKNQILEDKDFLDELKEALEI